jgi:hypothetical protein
VGKFEILGAPTLLKDVFNKFVLICVMGVLIGPGLLYAEGQADGSNRESVHQRIKYLEKRVTELEDVNALLMENLTNCVEENEELRRRLEAVEGQNAPFKKSQPQGIE